MLWYGMRGQKLLTLSMTKAEEHHIHFVERHLKGEAQRGVAQKTLVHVAHLVARIALTVGKHYLCFGVIHQQPYQFAAGIACRPQYTYSCHNLFF